MAHAPDLESRLPPSDLAAERALVGALLRENAQIADVVGAVQPRDFYSFANQLAFAAVVGLWEKGKAVDIVTVADAIDAAGQMSDLGGAGYIVDLWDSAPCAGNATEYAAIVREKARRRELIHACTEMTRRAFDAGESADELLAEAERKLFTIGRESAVTAAASLGDIATRALQRIYERADAGRDVTGVPSGWGDLDSLTAGAQPSELIIVGARPSVGKTAFLSGWLCHLGAERIPSLTFSIEQGRLDMGERMLCAVASVNSHRTRSGNISDRDVESLDGARRDFMAAPGLLVDRTDISPLDILAETRRAVAKHGIKIVFIDYLQLIRSEDRRVPRHEQVAATTRRLKLMARELNVPVVCLAQLNRDVEQGNRKPRLSDLKESGSIEQDADTVLFIHKAADATNVREIIVAKQRNGPTGDVVLTFRGEFMRFDNHSPDVPDEWKRTE